MLTAEILTSQLSKATALFPEETMMAAGAEWRVVKSVADIGTVGGVGGLWETYAFSLSGVKPAGATVPVARSRVTHRQSTYEIAGVEQTGPSDHYTFHLANPQRPV